MKNKYHYITPAFVGILIIGIVWFVTDLESRINIWQISRSIILGRLEALCIVIAMCYIYYVFVNVSIGYFTGRVRNNKPTMTIVEYGLAIIAGMLVLTIASLIITYFINNDTFTWAVIIKNNALVVPILFIYYVSMRSSKVAEDYHRQALHLEKVKAGQLETELKFLKSQYHPHFLFNALNTIYFQVDEKNGDAKQSIEQLSALLRYQLYDIEKEVTMEQEINYLKSYIAFQQLRMSERLILDLYFDPELKDQKIHPLLFQPLIENAFKYVRGDYRIKLEMRLNRNQIQSEIKNSISRLRDTDSKKEKGIGIENLKRRLDLLYPDRYNLGIEQTKDLFIVRLAITID